MATTDELETAARALGELNGRWLGRDDDLGRDHPWLLHRNPWHLPDYRTLRRRSEILTYRLPEVTVVRCQSVLDQLAHCEDDLRRRLGQLPRTLCHGDATRSNLVVRDGTVIMFDLTAWGIEPVGRDLADLLGLPHRPLTDGSALATRCLTAYRDGLRDAGAVIDDDEVAFGYRARFVRKAFWWLFMTIPRRLTPDAAALDARRRNIAADLARICDEAAVLVESASHLNRGGLRSLRSGDTSPSAPAY